MGSPRASQIPWSGRCQAEAAAFGLLEDDRRHVLGHALAGLRVDVDRVEQGAVDVVLALLVGGVSDPHRLRPDVASQVVERLLGQLRLAADAEHDLGLGAAAVEELADELHELARLLVEADHVQAPEGEGRVTDPGVPIVPVALPARRLGQRGGERGDHRPRRLVGQPLERQRRALEGPAPGVVRKRPPLQPAAPELDVAVDPADGVGGVARAAELLAPREAREAALPRLGAFANAAGDRSVDLERDVAEQAQRLAAAAGVGGQGVPVHERPACVGSVA